MLSKVLSLANRHNNDLLRVLIPSSEVLARMQHDFHAMLADRRNKGRPVIEISCYFEELPVQGVGKVSIHVIREACYLVLTSS